MRHVNLTVILTAGLLSASSAFASDLSNNLHEILNTSEISSEIAKPAPGECPGPIELSPSFGTQDTPKAQLPVDEARPGDEPKPLPGNPDEGARPVANIYDLNGDGIVGSADLLILMSQWGTCNEIGLGLGNSYCTADFNHDGFVLYEDLSFLMRFWTEAVPTK